MADFTLSPDQAEALEKFSAWLKLPAKSHKRPWFSIHGLAGSGKTSIGLKLVEQHKGQIYAMAYSGKAAEVLRRKGLPGKTIHSTIYLPATERNLEEEKLQEELRATPTLSPEKQRKIRNRLEALNQPAFTLRPQSPFAPNGIVVLDECSMCGPEEAEDLISFELPILVLGDPFQLAPIKGKGYFDHNPDFVLTHIHRQAAESPVIKLATMAREGRRPPLGVYGDSRVVSKNQITAAQLCAVDQVICGSNRKRIELNRLIRKHRGLIGEFPVKGDKIICLRNNYVTGVLNGQMFELAEDSGEENGKVSLPLTDGRRLFSHPECFTAPDELKSWNYRDRKRAEEVDWGACITGHRAQGSEWPNTVVIQDMFKWNPEELNRWTYSALTRASNSVILGL